MKTCRSKQHQYSESLRQCPECKKSWHAENKERHEANIANWRELNSEHYKKTHDVWQQVNKERHEANIANWRNNNRGKYNSYEAKRRATRLQVTPKWLTQKHIEEIQEYYTLAHELAWLNQDGKPFHVDHIVPLQGEMVSGLHVPWNLQLLPENENCSKGNKYVKNQD